MLLNKEDLKKEIQYSNIIKHFDNSSHLETDRKSPLKSSKMLSIVNSYEFFKTYSEDKITAFVGEQFPHEILYAFGISPVNLEGIAGLIARSDKVDEFLKLGDQNNFSRDICSSLKCSLGLVLANCYPTPNLLISASHPCDGFVKSMFIMSKLYDKEILSIDVPVEINDKTVIYLKKQFEDLIDRIGKNLGITFRNEVFNKIIQESNNARNYYFKTLQLCETKTLPDVFHELMKIAMVGTWGLKETTSVCKKLYEEALEIYNTVPDGIKKNRIIMHGQLSHYSDDIVKYLENSVEIIYFAPLLNANELLDVNDPLYSIAKRFINFSWNTEYMIKVIKQTVPKLNISGIVFLCPWGCRNLLGMTTILRDTARDCGLKVLVIDNDYLDKEKVAFNHIKNRMDAFLEIL